MKMKTLFLGRLFFCCYFMAVAHQSFAINKIAVIGAGYVGLVTSAILSDLGYTVICTDNDRAKIDSLNNGIIPIFEPGLSDLIHDVSFPVKSIILRSVSRKTLSFSCSVDLAVKASDIIFMAVGTPTNENGQANLDALKSACLTVAQNLNGYKIICIKSTVPIGTYKIIEELIESNLVEKVPFDLVSNPEFLRQGAALNDFLMRNPIVIGASNDKVLRVMEELYRPLINAQQLPLIMTDNITAETIKYSWNSFAAIKISYINEIAELCRKTGANIFTVIKGMGLNDSLLPLKAIIPGPGYGGSCLPKDTKAFVSIAQALGLDLKLVAAAIEANDQAKHIKVEKILNLLGLTTSTTAAQDKVVTLLGLSFKANTDDIRYSPALDIIRELLSRGIKIQVYDPAAMENVKKFYPQINYCSSVNEAVQGTDLIVILTEWQEFRDVDFVCISETVKNKVIYDTRYLLIQHNCVPQGYVYVN